MLKPAVGAGFLFGIPIENKDQVFHRILDLKHGLGFYPGFFYYSTLVIIAITSLCSCNLQLGTL